MRDDTQSGLERPTKFGSLSAVPTVIVALGIIFIGVREFFYPGVAAAGFGVPFLDRRDGDLLGIKGARDRGATKKGEIISFRQSIVALRGGRPIFCFLAAGLRGMLICLLHRRRPHV
jgi:hypothetical protein